MATKAASQGIDITGIALGSSSTAAAQKLSSEGFRVTSITLPWPELSAITANKSVQDVTHSGSQFSRPKEEFLVEGLSGRVAVISHETIFREGEQPNTEETVDSLLAKYGRKTTVNNPHPEQPDIYDLGWVFDQVGTTTPQNGPGSISCGSSSDLRVTDFKVNPFALDVIDAVRGPVVCSKSIDVTIRRNRQKNVHLVTDLRVTITDVNAVKAFSLKREQAQREKVNKQSNDAKQNKAPI